MSVSRRIGGKGPPVGLSRMCIIKLLGPLGGCRRHVWGGVMEGLLEED